MCRVTSSELSSAGLNLYKFMVASLHIEDVQAQLAAVRTEIDAVLMRVDAAAAAVDSLQAQLDTCNAAIAAGSQDGELAAHRAFLRQVRSAAALNLQAAAAKSAWHVCCRTLQERAQGRTGCACNTSN